MRVSCFILHTSTRVYTLYIHLHVLVDAHTPFPLPPLTTHQPIMRRLITRALGLVPSMAVAIAAGRNGVDTLLVASQVALSIVLPFIVFPLLWVTGDVGVMSVRKDLVEGVEGGVLGGDEGDASKDKKDRKKGDGDERVEDANAPTTMAEPSLALVPDSYPIPEGEYLYRTPIYDST